MSYQVQELAHMALRRACEKLSLDGWDELGEIRITEMIGLDVNLN